jgi:hypothetical protein
VQRVAGSGQTYRSLLGDDDPTLAVTDPARIKMRYASLGACGPDFLYALFDYGSDMQDMENILVKTAGTFSHLASVMGEVQTFIDGALSTFTQGVSDALEADLALASAVMREGLYALLATGGVNPLAFFEAARQKDHPREKWYWADVLHYFRSGTFARNLAVGAKATGNPNLIAYAYGYLTHYVTDVVGHPYVNQVVGGPWRLYWQRHHLVENFIDAYVWDRWHAPSVGAPGAAEPPLDRLVASANLTGGGAPMTFARLNDHVNIGTPTLGDPVDAIVDQVAASLQSLLDDIGIAEPTEPMPPRGQDFMDWTQLMERTIRNTYDGYHPTNLTTPYLLQGVPTSRKDGFPTADDIAAAYGGFRLLLRVTTEEGVQEPDPPNITTDISAAIAKIAADVTADLAGIPAPPAIPGGASFSPAAILAALEMAFEWAAQVAAAVMKAAFDAIADALALGGLIGADIIKYGLWLIAKALYAVYRSFRDILTLRAYAIPFTDQLETSLGGLALTSLWQSPGNPTSQGPGAPPSYPHEEIQAETVVFPSSYVPIAVPATPAEMPGFEFVAPYAPTTLPAVPPNQGVMTIPAMPDAFIDAPLGLDDLFSPTLGPQQPTIDPATGVPSFTTDPRDFGGAIANSIKAIDDAVADQLTLPNYNLDGDRSYAWPCWDVPQPVVQPNGTFTDPLNVTHITGPVATVTAEPLL